MTSASSSSRDSASLCERQHLEKSKAGERTRAENAKLHQVGRVVLGVPCEKARANVDTLRDRLIPERLLGSCSKLPVRSCGRGRRLAELE